ncbi:amidohydrolase [Thermaurantiacus sp.]
MVRLTSLLSLSVALLVAGCGTEREAAAPADSGALVITGGPILTMEGEAPAYVEAILVRDGRIVFAGSKAEAMRQGNGATVFRDLEGKTLLPGFIDPHSHFIDSMSLADRVNVSAPPAANAQAILAELKKAAAARNLKPGEELLGWGYDENLMPGGVLLTRDLLDEAFPDNPVAVIHVSMHGAVLNSRAMERYGYADGMATPEGGFIQRKPNGRDLAGLVMETAYMPMFAKLPGPTPETEVEAARKGQLLYAAAGITTAQEGATHAPQVEQLQRIARAGGLFIDVVAYPFITDLETIWKTNPPESFGRYVNGLKLGGCKITGDGSPQGKTAWFTTPYLTGGPAGETSYRGGPGIPPDAMKAAMKACYDRGLRVHFHANGDAAIDFLIAAHREAAGDGPAPGLKTVCIHCQFIRRDQIETFKALGIVPALFTDHTFFFGDTHIANRGLAQASFISPMKAAAEAGLRPTNHTDAFVVPIDQMMTVWTAVNRPLRSGGVLGPDQRITPYAALKAITIDAAAQYGEEADKGSIAVGKRADLVILSADPTAVDPMAIRDIKVVETIKDGRTIWPQAAEAGARR